MIPSISHNTIVDDVHGRRDTVKLPFIADCNIVLLVA